jgi:ubiquinone/menaquinone biosynthesis C-methylase UbiE
MNQPADPPNPHDPQAVFPWATRRTDPIEQARIDGGDIVETVAALAAEAAADPRTVLDVGSGRGLVTLRLARQYPQATLVAVDPSAAWLRVVDGRATKAGLAVRVHTTCADLDHLPLAADSIDLAVANRCLHHSPRPEAILTDLVRCLRPHGHLIVVTQSDDSYRDLDALLAASGLDPHATEHPSPFASFHTGNAADLLAGVGLSVHRRVEQRHTFRFTDPAHLAAYVATCPHYQLPPDLRWNPGRVEYELRKAVASAAVMAHATVTYLVAGCR